MRSLLLFLFCLTSLSAFSQKVRDSVLISIDTINVHGKVVDENGEIVKNAIITVNSKVDYIRYPHVLTNNEGNFKLEGISAISKFWVYTEKGNHSFENFGSRYLLIKVPFTKAILLNNKSVDIQINAKRVSDRTKIELRQINDKNSNEWVNYVQPATYPGGLSKFFAYIKEKAIYPETAIKAGVEGNVSVEFTVAETGNISSPILISDIGYGCGEQLINILKNSKKWNPALHYGKAVPTRFCIEIPFKLLD